MPFASRRSGVRFKHSTAICSTHNNSASRSIACQVVCITGTLASVELATLEWVAWFNNHRLIEPLSYIPPVEAEANYYRQLASQTARIERPLMLIGGGSPGVWTWAVHRGGRGSWLALRSSMETLEMRTF